MSNQSNKTSYIGLALAAGILVAVVVGIVIYTQKPRSSGTSYPGTSMPTDGSGPSRNSMGGGGPSSEANQMQGIGGRMAVGVVTAVDASTITIKKADGTSKTFTITDDTEILPGANQPAQSYDADSIEIGSTVAIEPDSSNSDQANAIALNYETKTNE